MTYHQFVMSLGVEYRLNKANKNNLRAGQLAWNLMEEFFPELSHEWHQTELDCFYDDEKLVPFLNALQVRLDSMEKK